MICWSKGTVTFEMTQKDTSGYRNMKISISFIIENIVLVNGLKHNLLNISQLCDKDFKIIFYFTSCIVVDSNNAYIFFGFREQCLYY